MRWLAMVLVLVHVPSLVAWAFGHCHGRRRWSKFGQLEAAGFFPALGVGRRHDRSPRAAALLAVLPRDCGLLRLDPGAAAARSS